MTHSWLRDDIEKATITFNDEEWKQIVEKAYTTLKVKSSNKAVWSSDLQKVCLKIAKQIRRRRIIQNVFNKRKR